MKGEEKQVKKAVEKVGETLKQTTSSDYEKLMQKATANAVTPKDLLKISDAQAEGIYAQAYRLYNTGKYKDACNLFRLLVMINATEAKYTLGMAACFHMQKEFKTAAEMYMLCSVIDPVSPIPPFHASDCFIQMKDLTSALFSLELAAQKAGQKPEYKVLKDRALLTIAALKNELGIKEPTAAKKT